LQKTFKRKKRAVVDVPVTAELATETGS